VTRRSGQGCSPSTMRSPTISDPRPAKAGGTPPGTPLARPRRDRISREKPARERNGTATPARRAGSRRGRIVCAVKCEACGDELPATGRSDRRYCDARCRRRAFEERHAAAPELAPVVPLSEDEQHVQELLGRVLRERLIGLVAAGAKTNWRAPAWILERRYPERWGPGATAGGAGARTAHRPRGRPVRRSGHARCAAAGAPRRRVA
jgi:hypothetical protein